MKAEVPLCVILPHSPAYHQGSHLGMHHTDLSCQANAVMNRSNVCQLWGYTCSISGLSAHLWRSLSTDMLSVKCEGVEKAPWRQSGYFSCLAEPWHFSVRTHQPISNLQLMTHLIQVYFPNSLTKHNNPWQTDFPKNV